MSPKGSFSKAIAAITAAKDALKKVAASLGEKTGGITDIILKNGTASPLDVSASRVARCCLSLVASHKA